MKVLIVEDDAGIAELLKSILDENGYESVNTQSGSGALAYLEEHSPKLMILDFGLPDMNGKELIEELVNRGHAVPPFIVSTGQGDERIAVDMMKLGAKDYVVKDNYFLDHIPDVINRVNRELENESKLKIAEEELITGEATFRTIVENVPVMINSFDKSGSCVIWNKEMQKQLGYSMEEIKKSSNPLGMIYSNEDPDSVLQNISRKDRIFRRYHPKAKNGAIKTQEWADVPLPDGRCVSIGIDLTKQTELEEQLRQSQKLESIGTFAGGIAHDFNNILAVILGNIEILSMKLHENSEGKRHLDNIAKAGKRGVDLVRQIMSFSRVDISDFKPLNLSSAVKEALELLKATIPSNIEISESLLEECPPIRADKTQIHQIILNLCANAMHSMETGGRLTVTLEELNQCPHPSVFGGGACLNLTITDTGLGIAAANLERIFDPFFTTKAYGKGTGLGLSVVHGIVEKHQGKIIVESKMGHGTTFSLFLPVIKAEISEISEISEASTKGILKGEGRILIIEDESALAELYQEFLQRLGYVVTLADNGSVALTLLQGNPKQFDLVLTDQTMPKMTGKQLIPKLLAIRSDLPIILCTGNSDLVAEDEVKILGIRECLIKPISMTLLHEVIEKSLG